jgi:hypothetical protein
MQYHLSRYAYLLESSLLSDAVTLVPKAAEDGPGLKAIMESIDNRADFKAYVQNYRIVHQGSGRGPRREGPAEQGFVSFTPGSPHSQLMYLHSSLPFHLITTDLDQIMGTCHKLTFILLVTWAAGERASLVSI